ncbi:MAG: TonB-dependent receptor [Desulfatiglans sp.]|nr:TonB-dependent receptor [Desulfatiglans sp.]
MGGKRNLFSNWLLYCFFLCTFALLVCGSAIGQEEKEEFSLEAIIVTGSRIARNNNDSVSPIVTVDEKLFDQSTTAAIETQLNKLPQFTPTIQVPTVTGDIQPFATNTPGSATIALRGIGTNRTLTLINGRRGTPSNASGALDINTIPTAAIEYVETITGGASSTYGADAMAGVLNFIMKDTFEGFEVDALGSISQYGDNEELTVSGIMGSNIADDRGNIMMAFAYNDRKKAMQGDRPWYKKNWRDPAIGGSALFAFDTAAIIEGASPDVLNNVMGLPEGQGFTTSPYSLNLFVDQKSGEVYSGYSGLFGPNGVQGVPAAQALGIVDGYNIKITNSGALAQNFTEAYLIYPMERYNFYTQGNYKINDYVGVFGQAYFARTRAQTIQEGSTISGGWSVNLDPSINREVIPTEVLAVLDSRPNADATFQIQGVPPVPRVGNTDTLTFNMVTGLEGKIPTIDWTWEAFVSHGEAETSSYMTGFFSLERFRSVISAPNFGRGGEWNGNEEYGNFGSAQAYCTSGLNPFDWTSVTQDCWEAIAAAVKSKSLVEQTIWEVNSQGRIMDLPGGEMRGAVGASFRENNYYFLSDNVNTQGRSFNDQILGLYPAGESEGTIKADEYYAELLVPIVKDLPFMDRVDLNLGGRSSDYNTTGKSYTYKAQLDWATTSFLRFRGGYNRAERAPNVGELYLARTSSFAMYQYGDVCSMDNRAVNWTASPENDGWQDVVNICGNLMEASGNTDADLEYYSTDFRNIVNYANANGGAVLPSMNDIDPETITPANPTGQTYIQAQPDGGLGFLWPVDVGNPRLDPETADTWTAGFVLDSWIETIPALMDWRISVDYYSIKVKDAIGLQTGEVVFQQCTSRQFNPTMDYLNPNCAGVLRNPDSGVLANLARTYMNNGYFETSGIDVQINWGMDAGPGHVSVSSLINHMLKMDSTELYGANPMIDYVGTTGPSGNGLNGNSFEWKFLTTFTYAFDKYEASLRWQHLDGLRSLGSANTPLPSYDMFDLMGNFQVTDNFRIRFGVDNLFNKAPKLYNVNPNATDGVTGGMFSNQLHDVLGRRFYVGAKVYF